MPIEAFRGIARRSGTWTKLFLARSNHGDDEEKVMPANLPLTIKDAAAALRSGTLTSLEPTQRMPARIDALQETLGAFVSVTADAALAQAEEADDNLAAGIDRGPLQGIPVAIISVAGTTTTANSRVLAPGWGGGVDAAKDSSG
jgi:aspartyl-tRNA(Asn)/glutamyl-tRNA(Gln) amidotransferase subunit A